jgi:hypothetical protein
VNTADIITSIAYLKTSLKELIEKIMDNRQVVVDTGEFIMKLRSPLPPDITREILEDGFEHVQAAKNELNEYIDDLNRIKVIAWRFL